VLDALPADARPFLSDISLWEVAMLVGLGRIELADPFDTWLDAAANPRTVRVLPITPAVAERDARGHGH
jgi:PIN domain nuclease of toxin-antitoxin system